MLSNSSMLQTYICAHYMTGAAKLKNLSLYGKEAALLLVKRQAMGGGLVVVHIVEFRESPLLKLLSSLKTVRNSLPSYGSSSSLRMTCVPRGARGPKAKRRAPTARRPTFSSPWSLVRVGILNTTKKTRHGCRWQARTRV